MHVHTIQQRKSGPAFYKAPGSSLVAIMVIIVDN